MSRVLASLRYVASLLVSTQRWAAPSLILVGLMAWVWITPPIGIDTVRVSLLVLFALAAWLGHATGSVEESGQEQVSTSSLGSASGLLAAKWAIAAAVAAVFPTLLISGWWTWGRQRAAVGSPPPLSDDQAWASILAVLVVAATAAALGVLVASLLPGHPGWASVILVLVGLSQAVPGWVPVSTLSSALPQPGNSPGVELAVALAVGAVLAAGLLATAVAVRRPAG
jgi:hypothetical protein